MSLKRVYAEIDLGNLVHNLNSVKARTNTEVMAVVKTDAYGHGAVECSKTLLQNGFCNFAVATAEEAIELCENGVTGRILILGYVFPEDYPSLLEKDVRLTVFDIETAGQIDSAAKALGKRAKIHLKIDTGMGRIGFLPDEKSFSQIVEISKLPNVEIEGIFTHFACADMADKSFTEKQRAVFESFVKKLEDAGVNIPIRHDCNSAGAMEFDGGFLDMVRSGIINYGLYPSDEVKFEKYDIKPVMSLISHVTLVKEVEAGFTVSYGSTFVAERKTKLATVPVGYGDGYPRSLSNCGIVLINGKRAPIAGRVCMDQFMVDVTDIPDVERGSRVTLVGEDGEERITVEELSALCGRFNYEFVCDINKRVPRVYRR
ncbi:MAG: alanine racemase [Clostridia bacterium]|nr:alanine racemase [Clostridia bacterium]